MHTSKAPGGNAPASSPALSCILYCSVAAQQIDEELASDLLATARRNNIRLGITGHLMADDGLFVQYLEGPTAAVSAVFAKISDDRRHRCVTLLHAQDRLAQRVYPEWTMGFGRVSRESLLGVVDAATQAAPRDSHWAQALPVLTRLLGDDLAGAGQRALAAADLHWASPS